MANNSQPFRFFDLPLEIRKAIYEEAFPSRTVTDGYRDRCTIDYPKFALTAYAWKINANKTSRDLVHKEFPQWIAPNLQFLVEAIYTFARSKVFEIKCRIDDISDDEEEERAEQKENEEEKKGGEEKEEADKHAEPMHARFILIQAIQSIKAAYIANKGSNSPNPDVLQLCAEDAGALLAFRNLRPGSLPPSLVLEWKYDVYKHSSPNNPRFVSTVLQNWRGSFRRVTIATTISDYRNQPTLPFEGQSKQKDNGPQQPAHNTPIISIRNRLRKQAEQWAWRLARSTSQGTPRVWLSEEKQFDHWRETRMYFQTVEAVDGETSKAIPLAVLDERYQTGT